MSLVLFLSLLKESFGKAVHAFSLTTHWGQSNLDSYDDFLATMNSNSGVIGGHHSEMSICVLTMVLPAFFAIVAFKTHDIMDGNSTNYWNKTEQNTGKGSSDVKAGDLDHLVAPHYNDSKISIAAYSCFICWYTWNVSVNIQGDNLIVPFSASMAVVTTYWRCLPLSLEVMDICSAIVKNDLSLQCDSPNTHDKNK